MPIIGAGLRVLAGMPRFFIFSASNIGYGSVDSSDSSTDTSTSTTPVVSAAASQCGQRRRVRRNRPRRTRRSVAPACTGGRSGSLLLTQPEAACTVKGVASRSRNGPFCPKSEMRTTTRSGLSAASASVPRPDPIQRSRPHAVDQQVAPARSGACSAARVAVEIDCRAALSRRSGTRTVPTCSDRRHRRETVPSAAADRRTAARSW